MAFKSAAAQARQAVPHQPFASRLKPEEQELVGKREEQARLEAELAQRELSAANLHAEWAAFERRYLYFVGLRYAELDRWKAKAAERQAQEQPYNERAQQAVTEAWAAAEDTEAIADGRQFGEPRAFRASPQLKRLYREVARRIHPDLGADPADWAKRQRLMAEANLAYERGDEAGLEKILIAYESSPETVSGKDAAAELVRVIRRISQIRNRMAEIEAEIQELLRSELWLLKWRVDEAAASGRDLLKEMIATVDEQIAAVKQRVQSSAPSVT